MKNNKAIQKLLTPSWLTNVAAVSIGILVTAGVIILTNYQSSALRFQIFDVQTRNIVDQQQGVYANITLEARESSFLGSLPLLITWAAVGLGVYFFAVTVAKSFGRAASMREQMNYVNASRRDITRQAVLRLIIRLLSIILWLMFIKLTISVLVPFALASASAAASEFSVQSVGYALLGAIVLYATVVAHVIFLRLVLLKPRVFGS